MNNVSKVLYICQNPTGVDTIELLATKHKDVYFLFLVCEEFFFNQKIILPDLPNIVRISLSISKSKVGFYGLSFFQD